ncbi:hypothetical protein GQR60_09525 [Labilibaculum sp. A4]|uniref:hypothetical protein n=1 Tax=Labilibaculum euxinus TaxID=2686357 RepID=UPI000F61A552|nr:hypothetical protein [Labilibaculum euxinus]MDQ1771532.1 hypothetical protein [Labilibaculum euxinus]MWN76579.1 hypothetical protein [Labilibaculum euxinus]
MKKLIFILLVAITYSTTAKPIKQEKSKIDSLINVLNTKIETISKTQSKLEATNKELQKYNQNLLEHNKKLDGQLVIHKIEEKFFNSYLGSQTGLFSLIVVGLLSLAGLISLNIIKNLQRKFESKIEESRNEFNSKIEEFRNEFDVIKIENRKMNKVLYITAANLFSSLSHGFREKIINNVSLLFSIRSAYFHFKGTQYAKEPKFTAIIASLKYSLEDCEIIKNKPEQIKILETKRKNALNDLNKISECTDEEVKNKCAHLRTSLIALLDKKK